MTVETVYDPPGISAAGNVTLWWVPAIADVTKPTTAEITAGINISNAVYAYGDGASQSKVERRKYGYSAATQAFGRISFEPSALEWDTDPQGAATGDAYSYEDTLVQGATGFIVHRRGFAPTVAAAAAQKVDVRPATIGYVARIDVGDTEGEMLRNRAEITFGGNWHDDSAIAA